MLAPEAVYVLMNKHEKFKLPGARAKGECDAGQGSNQPMTLRVEFGNAGAGYVAEPDAEKE